MPSPISPEKRALSISLGISIFLAALKWFALWLTGSTAILADASESLVHVVAVGFTAYSLRVAEIPPDEEHHFGHQKISYFAAGVEGTLIFSAAILIWVEAIYQLLFAPRHLSLPGWGAGLESISLLINTCLGIYMWRVAKKSDSFSVRSSAQHIVSDAWMNFGIVAGLLLSWAIREPWIDPVFALIFACVIFFPGLRLVRQAIAGLMDETNPELEARASASLTQFCQSKELRFHRLRLRESGNEVFVDFHLQFPNGTSIEAAHATATLAERAVCRALPQFVDILCHLEPFSIPEQDRDSLDP